MHWLVLCSVCYASYLLLVSAASTRINAWVSASIFNFVGAVLPLVILLIFRQNGQVLVSKAGIILSALAGVAIALYSFFLLKAFAALKTSFVTPMIFGATIVLTVFGGLLLFKENLTKAEFAGIGMIILGLITLGIART